MRRFPRLVGAVLAFTAAGSLACQQTSKVEIPDLTGPSSAHSSVILPGKATPAPTPAATPTPGPAAPAPTPGPTPPARSASCSLPAGNGSGDDCTRTTPAFLDALGASIDDLVRSEPDIFDLDQKKCDNCYHVRDLERFMSGLQSRLASRGLCVFDDGEELAIKNSNDFNDQYDVLTADFYLRRGDGSYRSTCRPAAF